MYFVMYYLIQSKIADISTNLNIHSDSQKSRSDGPDRAIIRQSDRMRKYGPEVMQKIYNGRQWRDRAEKVQSAAFYIHFRSGGRCVLRTFWNHCISKWFHLILRFCLLCVSGDLWSYNSQDDVFVVSPEPDVCCQVLDPRRHRCLILASDGLWNMVHGQEAINTLWNQTNEQQVTMAINEQG